MYCTNCGVKNDDRDRFCIECGAVLEVINTTAPEAPKNIDRGVKKTKKRTLVLIVTVILVLAIIGGGAYIFISRNNPGADKSSQFEVVDLTETEDEDIKHAEETTEEVGQVDLSVPDTDSRVESTPGDIAEPGADPSDSLDYTGGGQESDDTAAVT